MSDRRDIREVNDGAFRQYHRITIDREHTIAGLLYEPATCSCGERFDEASYAIGHAYSANSRLEDEACAEIEDAAHTLTDLLNSYKTATHQHPDDDIRILTIGHMEAKINRYRQSAGLEPLEWPDA